MATAQKSAAAVEHVIPIICISSDLTKNDFYIVFKAFIHNGSIKIGHLVGLGSKVHGSRFRVNRFANFPDVTDFTGYELYLSGLSFFEAEGLYAELFLKSRMLNASYLETFKNTDTNTIDNLRLTHCVNIGNNGHY